MYFKYPKAIITTQNKQEINPSINILRAQNRNIKIVRRVQPMVNPQIKPLLYEESNTNKMLWGEPTWFLFHTLAQKVNENSFPLIRKELFQLICRICGNLPCPECTNHATQYLHDINFDTITTKEQFKNMLWQFHNTVNSRKGYAQYPFNKLSIYERANAGNIVQNFLHHFEQKSYNMRLAAHTFHRSMAITYIRKWFLTYSQHFK